MVKTVLKSVTKSIGHGIKNDPEVQRLRNRHPRVFHFIKKRLTPDEKYGLYLTIGSLITLFFIYLFYKIVQGYIGQETITRVDLRVINLVSHFRTPGLSRFMLFTTYLASGEIISIALIFSLIVLFLLHNWSYIRSLLAFVIGGELFVWIIKTIMARPRPPLTEALVTETSYSFPSGHTFVAVAFYGLITFFLFDSLKKRYLKNISLILGVILIILIGASRIYLGAHWPSDVLASYASGLAWLTIIMTSTHIKKKFNPPIVQSPRLSSKAIIKITILLIIVFSAVTYFYYQSHPLKTVVITPISKTVIQTNEIDTKLFETLPKISETITAAPAEPINIIIVGNKEILDKAFINSGWFSLDRISFKTSLKIISAVFQKQPYPQTPGLPVFWDTHCNDIGFGKPTSANLASSRQHIHFWETPFITPNGQSIWVGTAHFDKEIKTIGKIILPIHSTELIVDKEREEVKTELEKNGFVKYFEKVNLTGLTYGTKKTGNNFLTDGQAYILYLQDK